MEARLEDFPGQFVAKLIFERRDFFFKFFLNVDHDAYRMVMPVIALWAIIAALLQVPTGFSRDQRPDRQKSKKAKDGDEEFSAQHDCRNGT